MPNLYPPGNPDVSGGNDPVRSAILGQMRRNGGPQPQTQPGQAPQAGAPVGAGGNEVAMHLSRALEALSRTGPTDENIAALQGFFSSLQELSRGIEGQQGSLGQAPMVAQAPMPPATAEATPLPPG